MCFFFANILEPALWRLNPQATLEKKLPITSTQEKEKNKEVKATTETHCTKTSHIREHHNLNKHSYGWWTGWWELTLPTNCSSCQQYSWTSRNWHSSLNAKTKARDSTNPQPTSNTRQKKRSKQHFYYWHYSTFQNSPNTHVIGCSTTSSRMICMVFCNLKSSQK